MMRRERHLIVSGRRHHPAFDFRDVCDNANAMSTSVARVARRGSRCCSAVLDTAGAFLSLAVATTIVRGIVDSHVVTVETVLAGLVGSHYFEPGHLVFRLPRAPSALIGLVGLPIVTAGWEAVDTAA